MQMSLFANQINTLIDTMSKVAEPKALEMKGWHRKEEGNECGFAACVCGHQALAPPSVYFYRSIPVFPWSINASAQNIACMLDNSCLQMTDVIVIAQSIYEGLGYIRKSKAVSSGLFSLEELNHPHLTKDHPTPAEAISYMKLILTKLEQYK